MFLKNSSSRVVGCCNGVVCLSYRYIPKTRADTVVLWNPSTRDAKFVPPQSRFKHENNLEFVQNRTIGFGFDPRNDDYKLVSVH